MHLPHTTLLQKYNSAVPRYTTYPTVPFWKRATDTALYPDFLRKISETSEPIGLYLHIPFCQSLCHYCGCHTKIRDPASGCASHYLSYVLKEIDLIQKNFDAPQKISELHLGGGTPHFLSITEFEKLMEHLRTAFNMQSLEECAIEIDPRTITLEKLARLRALGFNRISIGVQDLDPTVQQAVNRIQSFALIANIFAECKKLGFYSINFDLIYGLPFQTVASFQNTMEQILTLKPDRIALFGFAYVPWMKKHQRVLKKETLPTEAERLSIFLTARARLSEAGYQSIGMDHFALPQDALSQAYIQRRLKRNCMGYTTLSTQTYLGLGVSAIGSIADQAYFQNEHGLTPYYEKIRNHILPIEKYQLISSDDEKRRWVIHQLLCYFTIPKKAFFEKFQTSFDIYFSGVAEKLIALEQDGLLRNDTESLMVTEIGKIAIRVIASQFDVYLALQNRDQQFSKAL